MRRVLILALLPLALAHRPGVSLAELGPDSLALTFAEAEAADGGPEAWFDAASVTVDGRRCGVGPRSVRRVEGDGVEVRARLWCPPGARRYHAGFLRALPPGHRHDVEAVDATGDRRTVAVLDRGRLDADVVGIGALRALRQWVELGVEHILTGWDHLAFVLGLALGAARPRDLLVAATGFTLGHAVTLALGALGAVTAPASIVEPAIAASIAVVAIENLVAPPPPRRRGALAAAFGLIHGLGFAGALREIGLPVGARALGLVGFNVGIEVGQLVVLAAAVAALRVAGPEARRRLIGGGSLFLAGVGALAAAARLLG